MFISQEPGQINEDFPPRLLHFPLFLIFFPPNDNISQPPVFPVMYIIGPIMVRVSFKC